MACSTLEDMLALIRGTIDSAGKAGIQAHMSSGCKTCAENYPWLTELLAVTAKDDSFDFSEETIAWIGLGLTVGAIALPILIRHGLVPAEISSMAESLLTPPPPDPADASPDPVAA